MESGEVAEWMVFKADIMPSVIRLFRRSARSRGSREWYFIKGTSRYQG